MKEAFSAGLYGREAVIWQEQFRPDSYRRELLDEFALTLDEAARVSLARLSIAIGIHRGERTKLEAVLSYLPGLIDSATTMERLCLLERISDEKRALVDQHII